MKADTQVRTYNEGRHRGESLYMSCRIGNCVGSIYYISICNVVNVSPHRKVPLSGMEMYIVSSLQVLQDELNRIILDSLLEFIRKSDSTFQRGTDDWARGMRANEIPTAALVRGMLERGCTRKSLWHDQGSCHMPKFVYFDMLSMG